MSTFTKIPDAHRVRERTYDDGITIITRFALFSNKRSPLAPGRAVPESSTVSLGLDILATFYGETAKDMAETFAYGFSIGKSRK